MKSKANQDIRMRMKMVDLPMWMVADKIGVAEGTFVRWLRHEMDSDRKQQIMDVIEQIIKEEANGEN